MRGSLCFGLAILVAIATAGANAFRADDDEGEGDEVIEHVMKRAFKGDDSLVKRADADDLSDREKKTLLDMMTALSKARPERGGMDSWKKKTGALVSAAQDLVDGKAGAGGRLYAAASCKECHQIHKSKRRDD